MKINLDRNEQDALAQFSSSGMNAVGVMKKIFKFYIEDLRNIENIDPKGNMGLQALSRQEAHRTVKEVEALIFPDTVQKNSEPLPGEKKISQYR